MKDIDEIKDSIMEANPEALLMDGFDECLHGFTLIQTEEGTKAVACYDLRLIIKKHMDDGMTEEEAYEFFNFNQLGANVGPNSPSFIVVP